jgi:hypothetical protein
MNNNQESDYEIINIVESIAQKQSEEDEDNKDYELLELLKSIEKHANTYLNNVNPAEIIKQFEVIQKVENEILIEQLFKKYKSIFSDREKIKSYIVEIKAQSLDTLPSLSFINNPNNDKLLATILALLIEQFKESSSKKKISSQKTKELFTFITGNEIKLRLAELRKKIDYDQVCQNEIKQDEKNQNIDYEDLYEKLYQNLIDCFEHIHRIGYLDGLLHADVRLSKYIHSLLSYNYFNEGKDAVKSSSEIFNDNISAAIKNQAKRIYAKNKGQRLWHYQVADNIRNKILDFFDNKNKGNISENKDSDYTEIISIINEYQKEHRKSWNDIKDILKKKTKNDIFLESVKAVCPKECIRGVKKEK